MALLNLFNKLCIVVILRENLETKIVSSTCFTKSLIIKKKKKRKKCYSVYLVQQVLWNTEPIERTESPLIFIWLCEVGCYNKSWEGKKTHINHAVLYKPHNGSILSTMLQHTLIGEVSPLTFLGFSRFAKLRLE